MVVDQATRHASAAAIIAAEVASEGFSSLKAPVQLVTALDATIPYSEPMEAYLLPDEAKIVDAVQQAVGATDRRVAHVASPAAGRLDGAVGLELLRTMWRIPRLRGARRRARRVRTRCTVSST